MKQGIDFVCHAQEREGQPRADCRRRPGAHVWPPQHHQPDPTRPAGQGGARLPAEQRQDAAVAQPRGAATGTAKAHFPSFAVCFPIFKKKMQQIPNLGNESHLKWSHTGGPHMSRFVHSSIFIFNASYCVRQLEPSELTLTWSLEPPKPLHESQFSEPLHNSYCFQVCFFSPF